LLCGVTSLSGDVIRREAAVMRHCRASDSETELLLLLLLLRDGSASHSALVICHRAGQSRIYHLVTSGVRVTGAALRKRFNTSRFFDVENKNVI